MDNKSLGSKIVKGAFWTVLMRTSIRFLGIISIIILARILTPEDFGIVAKATMIYGFLELLSQFGFANALIKNQNATNEDYNTVWSLSIIRAIIIGFILFISAWPLSVYFHEPQLFLIIIIYGIISILKGFVNVGVVDFRRDMTFHLDFKFNVYNKVSSFIITIFIAYIYETFWALVIGSLANILSSLVLGYIMSSYRPKFEITKWKELFHFSKWVFGFEFLSAISTKLDLFILSRYSTSENIGLYSISYEIAGTPSSEISMPIARAALPGLSKLNHDITKFREMYLSTISLVLFIAFPASFGLSATADLTTLVLLGEKWSAASELIEILALFGLIRVINATGISAYMAFDRPDVLTKISAITLFIRIILLPIGMYTGGVIGLCWAILLSATLASSINLYIQNKIGMIILTNLFQAINRTVIATTIMWSTLIFFELPRFNSPIADLFSQIFIGAITFTISSVLLYKAFPYKNAPEKKVYTFLKKKFLNE